MKNFVILLIVFNLVFQVAQSQLLQNTAEDPPSDSRSNSNAMVNKEDYLFGYKTLFLTLGSTLYGRFLNIGFMAKRYSVEVEAAIQVKKIRFGRDSIRTNSNTSLTSTLNLGEPDSNVSLNIATVRSFRREKVKFLGALLELDAGLNLKTWFYKDDKVTVDSLSVYTPTNGTDGNQVKKFAYLNDGRMELSTGPSFKFKISSGKEKGEAVFNVIGNIDVNYFFSN